MDWDRRHGAIHVRAPPRRGHPTTVYSRTRAKAEQLIAAGAAWADSPAAVAASSDVVFTMVGFRRTCATSYFSEQGFLPGEGRTLFVDMTTTEPTLAREIQARAVARGCNAVDAPVSGAMWAPGTRRCRSWSAATPTRWPG
jgi:3-hydroxyisobutyrate dehydrogenase